MLCQTCAKRISSEDPLCLEQVGGHPPLEDAFAALVDRWGRSHLLPERVTIGRDLAGTLSIADASVSRHHAEMLRSDDGSWTLTDLGSANGTFVNGVRATFPVRLRSADIVSTATIGFYFVEMHDFEAARTPPSTVVANLEVQNTQKIIDPSSDRLPEVPLALYQHGPLGGGIVELNGHSIRLPTSQFALMRVLVERMRLDVAKPTPVRGFLRSSELIASLPWESTQPDENHLKQLVRRLRQALGAARLGDLVEARPRFGYRLRVVPKNGFHPGGVRS